MKTHRNVLIQNPGSKDFLADIFIGKNHDKKPLVIFCHGFKGFKDWGYFNQLGEAFAERGMIFCKFNFSHNGTTIERPEEFADLEAFGENNFMKEQADLDTLITWCLSKSELLKNDNMDANRIMLIGHSRGGGAVLTKAAQDSRVTHVATMASIDSFVSESWEHLRARWKEEGVWYIENSRTKQKMPLNYQLYDNTMSNLEVLNIEALCQKLEKPALIIHGDADKAVPHQAAINIGSWITGSNVIIVPRANHVFGGKHPWSQNNLPEQVTGIFEHMASFIQTD